MGAQRPLHSGPLGGQDSGITDFGQLWIERREWCVARSNDLPLLPSGPDGIHRTSAAQFPAECLLALRQNRRSTAIFSVRTTVQEP